VKKVTRGKKAPASSTRAKRTPRAAQRGDRRFVILTGLSGSGKTHAARALEDLGYFCVDNLPTLLIPTLAELAARDEAGLGKVALVADVRERGFIDNFPRVYRKLKTTPGVEPELIFLEASHTALVRRFSETRRPHPLARGRSVPEGITEERERMNAVRELADLVLDTSNLTVHELRERLTRLARDRTRSPEMVVTLESFGFRNGVPVNADLIFDVRFLKNPHFVDRLRPLTGRDEDVVRYMRRQPLTREFLERLTSFLRFALPQYVREGKSYLTIAIGCTAGRHRSVMVAEALQKPLSTLKGVRVRVAHRDS
jgi:UPF0042 nucleotide-binding protein